MPGLKTSEPSFAFSGNKVTPDEQDQIFTYTIIDPSISATFFGTSANAAATAITLTNVNADYPRNVRLAILGVAGGMGGTAVINGIDQFGRNQTESIGFATAAGGGTAAGTKVFASLTSATVTPVGLGGTAVGTTSLGVASGTTAGIANVFGLPYKIRAVRDVKAITWFNVGTATAINGGTVTSTYVGTANHTFQGTTVLVITDVYTVRIKPTYNSSNDAPVV